MAKLGEICKINMGQSPDSSSYNDKADGLPFFQGNADFGEINPTVRVWCNAPTKIAHSGDILISVRAPIGAMNYANTECCIGRGLAALTVNNPNYEQDFLWYALSSKIDELNSKGTGSTFKAINKKALEDTDIKEYSIDMQQKIVCILGGLNNLISKRKKQLAKLDELVKARFVEMFGDPVTNPKGWKMVPLGMLSNVGSSKRIFEKEYVDKGIPFYRTKEIVELSKGNSISTELFISTERFSEIKQKYGVPEKNDLLISAVGTIGVIWIVDGENDFYFKDGNLLRVNASDNFNSVYMKYLLERIIAEHKKQMSSGTAYAALTISGLMNMNVYDAPLELQNQFAAFVQQIDKSKLTVQQSLDKLEVLKKKLIQEYFIDGKTI